jgi:hypothetical protein
MRHFAIKSDNSGREITSGRSSIRGKRSSRKERKKEEKRKIPDESLEKLLPFAEST